MDEGVGGGTPQADDHQRLDDLELPVEPERTGAHLFDRWLAILDASGVEEAGAALDDVADVDVLAAHAVGRQTLIQKSARAAHERPAGGVLMLARPLAHKNQRRFGISLSKDDLVSGCREGAGS